jgi:hypothetical protein
MLTIASIFAIGSAGPQVLIATALLGCLTCTFDNQRR